MKSHLFKKIIACLIKFRYVIVTLFYSASMVFVAVSMMYYFTESNPVKYRFQLGNVLYSFVPQGWAFFTRDPREAQISIYKKDDDGKFSLLNTKNASCTYFFGLNRRPSKIMAELQYAKREIPIHYYVDTTFNYQSERIIKDNKSLKGYRFDNALYNPSLCGEYVIVYQKSVPWSWSSSLQKIKMPAEMVKVIFDCP